MLGFYNLITSYYTIIQHSEFENLAQSIGTPGCSEPKIEVATTEKQGKVIVISSLFTTPKFPPLSQHHQF